VAVFIGYGLSYYFQQQKDIFKKIIIYFLIIALFFTELSFIPTVAYSKIKLYPQAKELFTWMKNQPPNKVFLNFPIGFRLKPATNFDIIYVFNSRLHFKKIVNGYSGQTPPNYQMLINSLNSSGPQKSLLLLKAFKVNYLIYHFDFYNQPEKTKKWYINQLNLSDNIKYVTHFGKNYVYEVKYD